VGVSWAWLRVRSDFANNIRLSEISGALYVLIGVGSGSVPLCNVIDPIVAER